MAKEYTIKLNKMQATLLREFCSCVGGTPDGRNPRATFDTILEQLSNQGIRLPMGKTFVITDSVKQDYIVKGIYIEKKKRVKA